MWEREHGRATWQRDKHMQGPEARAWSVHWAAGSCIRLPVEGEGAGSQRGEVGRTRGAVLPEMLMASSSEVSHVLGMILKDE